MYENFSFDISIQNQCGRRGCITTPHGQIQTPAFIFCGTKASVKGITPTQLKELKSQIILSNTYHLFVNPGEQYLKERGGLHKFMAWNGPMLSDSGGFQIFSLGNGSVADEIKGKRSRDSTLLKIKEEGAYFKSYWDGSMQLLTPEKSIQMQKAMGTDLVVVLDECTPYHSDKRYTEKSMERSHRWEKRSFDEFCRISDGTQALYGIVQGGIHPDLRQRSAEFTNSHNFFATAIGGTLGATKDQMYEVIDMAMCHITKLRPIHLLGIGGISDIFNGVKRGIDTFDCVHPTRIARHGGALVKAAYRDKDGREHINLKRAEYAYNDLPIEPDCDCPTCQHFSKAYLHYLLRAKELLALQAITIHNIRFMNHLMEEIRRGIEINNLHEVEQKWK